MIDALFEPGDRVLLQRVLRETQVVRSPPRPNVANYLGVLVRALEERLGRGLRPFGSFLSIHISFLLLAAKVAIVVLCGAVAFALVRWMLHLRRAEGGDAENPRVSPNASAPPVERGGSLEIEERLAGGDPRAALEALWWWLARSLCGPKADPSWTSRELLDRARRADLLPLVAAFDRLSYGRGTPSVGDVKGLFLRFREAVS